MTNQTVCPVCAETGEFAYSARTTEEFAPEGLWDYFRCTHCGLLYQQPMPTPEQIASFYPDEYAAYRPPTRTEYSYRERLTLRDRLGYSHIALDGNRKAGDRLRRPKPVNTVTPWVPGGRLLDVGCGNGEYLLRMKTLGWECCGVEFSAQGAAVCREHGLDVRHGGLIEAGFDDNCFDLLTAHHFIEHVPNPREIMAEMVRITKPGGRILLRTPNSKALGRRWFNDSWFANGVPAHLLLFSQRSLEHMALSHGLVLENRYRPVEHKLILKSLAIKRGRKGAKHGKLAKWLAKLYIPAARAAGQGDELFDIYIKPAT